MPSRARSDGHVPLRRLGVPSRSDRSAATKTGVGLVALAAGLSLVVVLLPSAPPTLDRTGGLILVSVVFAFSGALALVHSKVSWNALYGLIFVPIVALTVGQFIAGPEQPFLVMFYVWVAVFASYFFSRIKTALVVAAIAVSYGALILIQEGNASPAGRWLFVVGTIMVTVAFVNALVEASDRSAAAERRAREDEERARIELAELNQALEARVAEQVGEMERLSRLRRFLSANLAEVVLSSEDSLLEPHRKEIAIFFVDLRGFTRFASGTEPEDVLEVLDSFYSGLGRILSRFEATVGSFQGDGVMAFFNDPLPCPDPAARAVEMALALRPVLDSLVEGWRAKGYELGYGIGIAYGYATLGMIGFEGRQDYGPIGTVVNLASRLSDHASPGQVLVDRRTQTATATTVQTKHVGALEMKGFRDPVDIFEVVRPEVGAASTAPIRQ